jgi:hypothetical protein
MARLPDPRHGGILKIKTRPLAFSLWPVGQTTRRNRLQSHIFATDPWPIIIQSIRKRCSLENKDAALAFAKQAEEYYRAATLAGVVAAKPILLYYCFMNLVKAYILTSGSATLLSTRAFHGLSEELRPGLKELSGAFLKAYPSDANRFNVFDGLFSALTGNGLTTLTEYNLMDLLPQIVAGHRLWTIASGKKERFISIEDIRFYTDPVEKNIWLRFYLFSDDLTRLDVTRKELLESANLEHDWHEVKCEDMAHGRRLLCFEQKEVVRYSGRPSDEVPKLINNIKPKIWATVQISSPYRRYYLYMANNGEHVLPQILSIYAVMYYFSSITRYRPHRFNEIVADNYYSMIETLLSDQPTQFIYLLASEFAQQDVTKAGLV